MSLAVAIKGPEGVVLAADSRVTLTAERKGQSPIPVNFDNATKLMSFSHPHNHVGVVTYGTAVIGLRTAHSFIPEFEETEIGENRLNVEDYAKRLSEFFLKQWNQWSKNIPQKEREKIPPMVFIVGGYDIKAAYGRIFLFSIPFEPEPIERNPGTNNFGMTWGGQLKIASRIIQGYDPALKSILKELQNLDNDKVNELFKKIEERLEFSIPYQVLPLQDCVDLAAFMIKTTINAQNLSIGIRGVGGPADIATITRTKGLEYITKKEIKADEF